MGKYLTFFFIFDTIVWYNLDIVWEEKIMRRKERYKRLLSIFLAAVIIVVQTAIYAYVWFTC